MNREQYFMMMEQLGKDPIPEEIPYDISDFPSQVQEALNIFSILPDNWEGFSGTYMGKDYSILPYLMTEVYRVENVQETMTYLNIIGRIVMEIRTEEQKRRQKKSESKKGGIHIRG